MTWILKDKEMAAVLQLDAPERYSYWLKKVVDQAVCLYKTPYDLLALVADDAGHQLVPVWPHEQFAQLCARDAWASYAPRPIELNVWMERWIPGMTRDGKLVAVFPVPGNRGIPVEPTRMNDDLRVELTKYE